MGGQDPREGPSGGGSRDSAGPNLIDQIFDLWVQPELGRRGQMHMSDVQKALIVMPPDGAVTTLLNDEVRFEATARVTRAVEAGEPLYERDISEISDLRPLGIDPNAGWVGFSLFKGTYLVAFDLRRNKESASRKLSVARTYFDLATTALERGYLEACTENLFCAAELAVKAELVLHFDEMKSHIETKRWYKGWAELGNVPEDFSRALATLVKHRRSARYVEGHLKLDAGHLKDIAQLVERMLGRATEQIVGRASRVTMRWGE